MTDRYRWEYPIRADVVERVPGRVIKAARAAAIRDAADDGWRPGSTPHVSYRPAASDRWVTVRVEFDAAPLDDACDLTPCADCGQRPAWGGSGARRCRTCVATRDWETNAAPDASLVCGDKRGTPTGYGRHQRADDTPCGPCKTAIAAGQRRRRANA